MGREEGNMIKTKTQYAVKGLSAMDNIPTGPFNSYKEAKDYLLMNTPADHIKKHFEGDIKKWCEFMIFKINQYGRY